MSLEFPAQRADRLTVENEELRVELAHMRMLAASLVAAKGGEIRITPRTLRLIDRTAHIEHFVDAITGESVWRAEL